MTGDSGAAKEAQSGVGLSAPNRGEPKQDAALK